MTVSVSAVGGFARHPHGNERDSCGRKIQCRMGCFGQDSQTAAEQADDDFQTCQEGSGSQRIERCAIFFVVVRRHWLWVVGSPSRVANLAKPEADGQPISHDVSASRCQVGSALAQTYLAASCEFAGLSTDKTDLSKQVPGIAAGACLRKP